jgi:hypothetical protein
LKADILLQGELNYPSLLWLERRRWNANRHPLASTLHHLRCSEQHPAWQSVFSRLAAWLCLTCVDASIFKSQTARQAVAQTGVNLNACALMVAYSDKERSYAWIAKRHAPIERREVVYLAHQLDFTGSIDPATRGGPA